MSIILTVRKLPIEKINIWKSERNKKTEDAVSKGWKFAKGTRETVKKRI